jgi:hypothetical protein
MKPLRMGLYACSVLLPLVLLFNLTSSFYFDWQSNLWLVGYQGEYLLHRGALPDVINTLPSVGSPLPLFYGFLFYPVVGAVSTVAGPALALRIAALFIVALQFYALVEAGRRTFRNAGVTYLAAVSVIWSTYSLTNLYNRSDVTEFFATGLLVSCVAFLVAAASAPAGAGRRFFLGAAFVSALVAAGTHPPTAVLAAPLLLVICAPLVAGGFRSKAGFRRTDWAAAAAALALGGLTLSPWLYVTMRMRDRLAILGEWDSPTLKFFADRCDNVFSRFCPFPFDGFSTLQGTVNVSTPYLEAPVIFTLLGLLAWNLHLLLRSRREPRPGSAGTTPWEWASPWVLPAAVAWFCVLAALSLSPSLAGLGVVRQLSPMIQFAYRLVSHCNVALLAAVFASGALIGRRGGYLRHAQGTRIVVAVGLAIALEGVAIKLLHANTIILHPDPALYSPHGDRSQLAIQGNSSLDWPYSTPGLLRPLSDDASASAPWAIFPVGSHGADFGRVSDAEVDTPAAGWVMTNAIVFPWTGIVVNGRKPAPDHFATFNHFLAVYLPAGHSTLRWTWSPDPVWSFLHRLSFAAYVLVLAAITLWAAARALRSGSAEPREGADSPPW